jgi:hypothetical protein
VGTVGAVGAVGGARYLVLAVSPSVFATMAAASASGSAISKVTSTAAFTGFLGGAGFGFAASSFAFIDAMARKSAEPAVAVKAPGYISRTSSKLASASSSLANVPSRNRYRVRPSSVT